MEVSMADSFNTATLSKLHPALSRRSLMREIAAGAALAVVSSGAKAAQSDDAELIELGNELARVNAKWREIGDRVSQLAGVAADQYPPLPAVLKARPSDKPFGLPKPNDGQWYFPTKGGNREEPGYYATGQLNELKQFRPIRRVEIPINEYHRDKFGPDDPLAVLYLNDEVFIKVVPYPEAQERTDELIVAIEQWRKGCQKIDHACGYMKAEREFRRLGNKDHALLEKICALEAKTLPGIMVKARAVKLIHADSETIEFGDTTDVSLAAAALNDLLALDV
jgi:hypothetical protein